LAPVLFVKVSKLSDRKADPVLLTTKARPPPLPEPALLPVRVLLNSDSEPSLSMPAPRSETLPLAMVRPEIDTLVPRRVWKTRWALLPLTVMVAAPGPWTVRLWSMASSPLVRVIVPPRPLAKLTVSPAAEAAIWPRSEPAPLSSRFVTVSVAGTARSSRARKAGPGGGPRAGRREGAGSGELARAHARPGGGGRGGC